MVGSPPFPPPPSLKSADIHLCFFTCARGRRFMCREMPPLTHEAAEGRTYSGSAIMNSSISRSGPLDSLPASPIYERHSQRHSWTSGAERTVTRCGSEMAPPHSCSSHQMNWHTEFSSPQLPVLGIPSPSCQRCCEYCNTKLHFLPAKLSVPKCLGLHL